MHRVGTWVLTSALIFGLWSCSTQSASPPHESAESAIREARALGKSGDHAGASRILTAELQHEPANPELYYYRGLSRRNDSDLAGAVEDFSQAIARDSRNPDYFTFRGQVQNMRGRHEDAIKDYDAAIRLDSGHSRAYEGRGSARSDAGDVKGAIEDFTRSIELDARNVQAIRLRATARLDGYQSMSKPERELAVAESMADLSLALAVEPRNAVVIGQRGQVCMLKAVEAKSKDEARELLSQAVRDFETCVGSIELNSKRKAQARTLLETANRLLAEIEPWD